MQRSETRRAFLAVVGSAALLDACRDRAPTATAAAGEASGTRPAIGSSAPPAPPEQNNDDVGAVEDLMREHGVIRRILVVYREAAVRLRVNPTSVPADMLQKAATLIRKFGEDYHERQLEEAHVFPAVKRAGRPAANAVDTLIAQHQRGREITDYALAVSARPIDAAAAEPFARALEGFARMYEEHAAQEDTVLFPAWKKALARDELREMGEHFEAIEHRAFGRDGFEDAIGQVAAIEKGFGIDLAAMTAPATPRR